MKALYFVRHGQSEWNVADRICGKTDIPLTKKGHEQAIETGKKILEEGIKVDQIIYSPLQRAADTAKHISEMTGIPARVEPRIIEQDFGKWEGTSPRSAEAFQADKKQFVKRYEGGESMLHLAQRIYNVLDELKNDDRTYMIVAHNGIARVVKSYFDEMTNDEYSAYGVPNCTVMRFDFDEE